MKVIKTDQQYAAYEAEAQLLAERNPPPGTDAADRLELLHQLMASYRRDRMRSRCADPVSAIRFVMQERGLRQKDIAPLLGGKNRASEILSRKRRLTLPMVRKLSESLEIPADILITETELETPEAAQ